MEAIKTTKRKYKFWTLEEEKQARRWRAEGMTCQEIADALGRGERSVQNRLEARTKGVEKPDVTDLTVALLGQWDNWATAAQLAESSLWSPAEIDRVLNASPYFRCRYVDGEFFYSLIGG